MTTKEYVEQMDMNTAARWLCFLEGVEVIFNELEAAGMCNEDDEVDKRLFNKIDRSLVKYINERFHTVRADLIMEYGEF